MTGSSPAESLLQDASDRARKVGVKKIETDAVPGDPVDVLVDLIGKHSADLIIVGSRGVTGLERVLVGSTSERIVREAGCTVEVARPKRYAEVELIPVEPVEPVHTYVPPHRYTYEDHRVNLRPAEWPLY